MTYETSSPTLHDRSRPRRAQGRSRVSGLVWAAAVVAACDDVNLGRIEVRPVEGPEQVDFGVVGAGGRATRALVLESDNGLTFSARLELSGASADAFVVPSEVTVRPGQTELSLTYRPVLRESRDEASLTLTFDAELPPLRVRLVGEVVPGGFVFRPGRLDYGRVVVGSEVTAATRLVSRDAASNELALTLTGAPGFSLESPAEVTLAPLDTSTVTVRLAVPRDRPGPLNAELEASSRRGARATAQLSAVAIDTPLVCTSPLDLGYLPGPGRLTRTATCANRSDQPLVLGPLEGAGEGWSAELAQTRLDPRAETTLQVVYTRGPSDLDGERREARFTVPARVDGPAPGDGRPAQVVAEVRLGAPALTVRPSRLDFEQVLVGTTATQILYIENPSLWPVLVDPVMINGDGAFQSWVTVEVQPGETQALPVRFRPAAPGPASATLRLTFPGGAPVAIPLTGEGFEGPYCQHLRVTAPESFGSVWVGFRNELPVRFRNEGREDCIVGPFHVPPSAEGFTRSGPSRQIVLRPGEQNDVRFAFTPMREGVISETATFYVNGRGSSIQVELRGAGVTWRRLPEHPVPNTSFIYLRWPVAAYPRSLSFHVDQDVCAAHSELVYLNEIYGYHWDLPFHRPIGTPQIRGPDRAAFALTGTIAHPVPNPRSSWPGDIYRVDYQPSNAGAHEAWLTVDAEGVPEPVVVPLRGRAGSGVVVEETFAGDQKLDVLLLVDPFDPNAEVDMGDGTTRPVMLGGYAALGAAFEDLFEAGVDLQVGVVQTNMRGKMPFQAPVASCSAFDVEVHSGRDFSAPGAWPDDGLCGFLADGRGRAPAGEDWRILTAATRPSPSEALLALTDIRHLSSDWAALWSLDPSFIATAWPLAHSWNAGLIRPGASVAVVYVGWGFAAGISFGFEHLNALKGRRSDVMGSHALIERTPSERWVQREGRRDLRKTCPEIGPDSLEQMLRTHPALGASQLLDRWVLPTGGHVTLASCGADWAERLTRRGLPLNGLRERYPLHHPAEESTLEVLIDGVPLAPVATNGEPRWRYDAEYNRLDFVTGHAPNLGQDLTIRYRRPCAP